MAFHQGLRGNRQSWHLPWRVAYSHCARTGRSSRHARWKPRFSAEKLISRLNRWGAYNPTHVVRIVARFPCEERSEDELKTTLSPTEDACRLRHLQRGRSSPECRLYNGCCTWFGDPAKSEPGRN